MLYAVRICRVQIRYWRADWMLGRPDIRSIIIVTCKRLSPIFFFVKTFSFRPDITKSRCLVLIISRKYNYKVTLSCLSIRQFNTEYLCVFLVRKTLTLLPSCFFVLRTFQPIIFEDETRHGGYLFRVWYHHRNRLCWRTGMSITKVNLKYLQIIFLILFVHQRNTWKSKVSSSDIVHKNQ